MPVLELDVNIGPTAAYAIALMHQGVIGLDHVPQGEDKQCDQDVRTVQAVS